MTVYPILAVGFFMNVAAVLFVICAVVLILTILIQKGRGGGLGAAFGGGLASGILGSKTGDFLTWVTIALVGVFLTLAVVMAKFYKPTISDYGENQTQPGQQLPVQQPPLEPLPAQQPPVQQETQPGSELPLAPPETVDGSADVNLPGE